MKITGFKSFADRTRLELEPGVTVVVGPNGSGKSNIVDSIAWVMGTQSTKSLRTERMEDVIFAGTATRPALNRAEVTLIFDNSGRSVPLELDEVSVTRRLYRDGSSDYEINGVECRLLDVQDMLSDSGVGRHQHVIVGQGQLDAILNAKPDDHRAVIEEAAGILKHRLRKERSTRRLERTDQDVLRIMDIAKELKRQLRPLKRQAEDAERYDGLKAEIVALRLHTSGQELRSIGTRLEDASEEQARIGGGRDSAVRELASIESSLEGLADAAGEAGRALDRDTAAAARLETTAERLRSIAHLAAERIRALKAKLEGADERRQDLVLEQETIEANLEGSRQREVETAEQIERAERVLSALEDEERSLAEQEQMPTEGAVAMLRGDLRSLHAAADRDAREGIDLTQRLEALRAQVAIESGEIDRLVADIEATDVLAGAAQAAYQEARAGRSSDQETWESADERLRAAEVAIAGCEARLEAFEVALRGLADPVARERIERAPAATGALSTALHIPDHLAAAVDAALGPWADAITVADHLSVEDMVSGLKADRLGGVPMVAPPAETYDMIARPIAEEAGLEALVDRLGPAADKRLAAMLLGDVVLAPGWSKAYAAAQQHPQVRVVTTEGDLVTSHAIRVAHPEGASPAMVEAAKADLERAREEGARARSLATSGRRALDGAYQLERGSMEELEQLAATLSSATETLDRRTRAREQNQAEIARLSGRQETIAESHANRLRQIEVLQQRLAALEGEEAERQEAWEQLVERRQVVARKRDEARRARQEVAAAHGASVERRAMLERRLAEVKAELHDLSEHPVDPGQITHHAGVESSARAALTVVRSNIEALRERQVVLRREAGEAGRRLAEARSRRDELQASVSAAKDRLSQLAVEMAEMRVRRESIAEGLRRDIDASEEEALAASEPAYDDSVDRIARLETLEADLRRMGPVNPLAAQEYHDLDERYEHIQSEMRDLDEARDELKRVVRSLDEKIEELFVEAFHEVAAFYEENFAVLFPGGRGKVVLTDPDRPLTSGVDIKAQPLGKKVSRLQLLSGGERSLAALAFLFAVFKARPSPFYIMDEVEAALDDANLRRFLRLVASFRGAAQLVIVTHQQQTMEAADTLYGVTMEPGGSSQVVAKRMTGQLVLDPS